VDCVDRGPWDLRLGPWRDSRTEEADADAEYAEYAEYLEGSNPLFLSSSSKQAFLLSFLSLFLSF